MTNSVFRQKTSESLWAAVLLLWLLFAQMTFEARLTSLTVDEPLHIISGYSQLRTGDARLVEEHPPLAKIIAAAPLLLEPALGDPRQANGWEAGSLVLVARAMLTQYSALERVTFAARAPIMWLGLILAALVYRWAADWRRGGRTRGLIALGLCALDPNIVAHAQLATTDVCVALFILATFHSLWRWTRRPTWPRLTVAGLMLGLALASKMSALLALPVVALNVFAAFAQRQPDRWRGALRQFGHAVVTWIAIVGLSALVVWAVYGFELRRVPGFPLPIPAYSHLIPLKSLFDHQRAGHSTFLMGRNSQMGWWDYFPIAFAIKTPLPTLILLLSAVLDTAFIAIRQRGQKRLGPLGPSARQAALLLGFPVVYFASATTSTVDLGYRHLLPILPFAFVLAAQVPLPQTTNVKSQIGRIALGALAAWYALDAALAFPRPLEFFNELTGGAVNGYHYLVDSNLDWGQSFKELASYLKQHNIERIKLSAFTFLDPAMYGLNYDSLPPSFKSSAHLDSPFNPAPGVYVIGATSLQGVATPDVNTYAFFRARLPTARIGNGLFVYDIRQAGTGSWVAQCTSPAAPLEPTNIQAGFGRADLRRVYFDCGRSWWYPSSAVPGWYVDPLEHTGDRATWYAGSTVVYDARRADGKPFFQILYVEHPQLPPEMITTARTEQGQAISMPAMTAGPLALDGYRVPAPSNVAQRGTQMTFWTAWRVTAAPTRLVSIMAHLSAPDGHVIATGDGLGVPIESWNIGDLIVQAHSLNLPQDAAPGTYQVTTGVYALDDLKRFPILVDGKQAGDQLILTDIQVK